MCSMIGRSVCSCLRPLSQYARMNRDESEDDFVWSKDLEKHHKGEFSFAVIQANLVLEDHGQVETGRNATFVGVYDGHGGPEASRYICDHLFRHLLRIAQENGMISKDVIKKAVSETEKGFLTLVRQAYAIKPAIAAIGSCCLVGVIWKGTLYIANLGDSRAVLGYVDGSDKIVSEQLTRDHNAGLEEIQKELKAMHPEDSQILVKKNGAWRIKGIIQVSRSIGDAYLKRPEFGLDSSFTKFHLSEPLSQPVLRSDPAMFTRDLQINDKFVIFASDGLWGLLSNQEAVEIVHTNPRMGIARRLIVSGLEKLAAASNATYSELKKLDPDFRRQVYDDITVVVVFIDHDNIDEDTAPEQLLSVRGFVDAVGSSDFNF